MLVSSTRTYGMGMAYEEPKQQVMPNSSDLLHHGQIDRRLNHAHDGNILHSSICKAVSYKVDFLTAMPPSWTCACQLFHWQLCLLPYYSLAGCDQSESSQDRPQSSTLGSNNRPSYNLMPYTPHWPANWSISFKSIQIHLINPWRPLIIPTINIA